MVTKVHELAGNSRNPKNGHFLGRHFSVCRFGQRNFPDDSAKAESLGSLSVILILFLQLRSFFPNNISPWILGVTRPLRERQVLTELVNQLAELNWGSTADWSLYNLLFYIFHQPISIIRLRPKSGHKGYPQYTGEQPHQFMFLLTRITSITDKYMCKVYINNKRIYLIRGNKYQNWRGCRPPSQSREWGYPYHSLVAAFTGLLFGHYTIPCIKNIALWWAIFLYLGSYGD